VTAEIISPNNVLANAMLRTIDMIRPRIEACRPERVALFIGTQVNGARTWALPWYRPPRSCWPRPPNAPSTSTR
jgi:hypothetical protein